MNKKFSQHWLEIVCTLTKGCEAGLLMIAEEKTRKLRIAAKWPATLSNLKVFNGVVKYVLKKKQPVYFPRSVKSDHGAWDICAVPLILGDKLAGILTLRMEPQETETQSALLGSLKQHVAWLRLGTLGQARGEDFFARIVGLLASCFEHRHYHQGLVSMVTELTRILACEKAAYGEYHGHYSQVTVLTNSASFDDRSNLVQQIANAMDEAIEQDQIIAFPDDTTRLILRAHRELSRKFGTGSILSIPLGQDGVIFGAITLMRGEDNPFDAETIQLCQQTFSLLGPYLLLMKEQDRSLPAKLGTRMKTALGKLFGVKHLGKKLTALMLVSLLGFSGLLEGDFRVTADAVLEGKVQRVVNAPFSGYLLSAAVRAGDTVNEGQVMASLNDTEIRLQLAKLDGELQKTRRQYREAQSNRDLVNVRVLNEKINQVNAEIDLALQQLEHLNMTAPFDGVVIEGDLSQKLGAPVERGETLFKIAPLEGYRIILKVSERDISFVREGQHGRLVLPSLSDQELELTVNKITVAAKAEDGANIFRVEAALTDHNQLLRPGMQGVGKIEVGRSRLIWIWTREIVDWLRLWLWSWLP